MHPRESHRLRPGTLVWIWIVRLAKGRWWPGIVESLRTVDDQLRLTVKFECRPPNNRDEPPVMVGITTTAMRYLEPRDVDAQGNDQPRHTPISLLERPEEWVTSRAQPEPQGIVRQMRGI